MRIDPGEFPAGREKIEFELCIEKGTLAGNYTCAGGKNQPNVGTTITYSYGPNDQMTDPATGEYYFGKIWRDGDACDVS
jgi:hypothetical protein